MITGIKWVAAGAIASLSLVGVMNTQMVQENTEVVIEEAADMVDEIMNALGSQESNDDYSAKNASGSGATGRWQVMEENIGPWSQEVLGERLSVADFHESPELQNRVVRGKLEQYWETAIAETGGDEDEAVRCVAAIWYSGQCGLRDSTTPQYWNGNPYPSISDYADSVLERTQQ